MSVLARLRKLNREWLLLGGSTAVLVVVALIAVALAASGSDDEASPVAVNASATAATAGTADATASTTPEGTVLGATMRIGETGGTGVSLRSDCAEAAREPGAIADGVEVTVLQIGSGDCEGWFVVRAGEVASWVSETYLVEGEGTGASTVASGTGSAASSNPGATSGGTTTSVPAASTPKPAATKAPAPALPAFEFTALDGQVMTIADLEGAKLYGGGETGYTYLGIVSRSRTAAESICNPSGKYGIIISDTNMRNPETAFGHGPGGSPYHPYFESPYSAYMPGASSPPRVTVNGSAVAFISVSSGGYKIHPDVFFAHLGC